MAAEGPLIVSIVGTRPEAIKMSPVVRALAARGDVRQLVVLTGQHRDLSGTFEHAAAILPLPFDPAGRSAGKLREAMHGALCAALIGDLVDLVLVHGDTATALAGAFAAHDRMIPIGHVEAGLRSFDFRHPWPEEGNRVAIDAMSALLFAPTQGAARNLAADPHVSGEILITGNTGIDALFHVAAALPPPPPPSPGERRLVLATCHRKENQGPPLEGIARALRRIADELPIRLVMPLHPNPQVRAQTLSLLGGSDYIELVEPLEHAELVALLVRCWAVITDSGGLQEEAASLGRPLLVLRGVTERPEAEPNAILVGADPERIFAAAARLLADPPLHARMSRPNPAFGDGRAAIRIAAACRRFAAGRRGLRRRR